MTEEHKYFKHFKGGNYVLLAFGHDSESLTDVVVYQALYGNHEVWVRPKAMFFENVVIEGRVIPRFKEITKEEAYAEK